MRIEFPRSPLTRGLFPAKDRAPGDGELDHCARRAAEAFLAANRAPSPVVRAQQLMLAYRFQERLDRLRRQLRLNRSGA